jgi:hypothetical protein
MFQKDKILYHILIKYELRQNSKTWFSKLFENSEYKKAWEDKKQLQIKKAYFDNLKKDE